MLSTKKSLWTLFIQKESNTVQNIMLPNKVNYWTGDDYRKFEKEFAVWLNSKYVVVLENVVQSLDVALKALNIGDGDEVIVTSRTFSDLLASGER